MPSIFDTLLQQNLTKRKKQSLGFESNNPSLMQKWVVALNHNLLQGVHTFLHKMKYANCQDLTIFKPLFSLALKNFA